MLSSLFRTKKTEVAAPVAHSSIIATMEANKQLLPTLTAPLGYSIADKTKLEVSKPYYLLICDYLVEDRFWTEIKMNGKDPNTRLTITKTTKHITTSPDTDGSTPTTPLRVIQLPIDKPLNPRAAADPYELGTFDGYLDGKECHIRDEKGATFSYMSHLPNRFKYALFKKPVKENNLDKFEYNAVLVDAQLPEILIPILSKNQEGGGGQKASKNKAKIESSKEKNQPKINHLFIKQMIFNSRIILAHYFMRQNHIQWKPLN